MTIRRRLIPLIALLSIVVSGLVAQERRPEPRIFLDDDPIAREPDTRDASDVREWEIDLATDLVINTFSRPGDPRLGTRALNVNTIDEVPDSSWFTNRVYARPLGLQELRRGPNTIDGPAPGAWTVIRPKSAGFAPGFTIRDSKGEVWFITFDPIGSPRAATGAIAVASRLFWALGYHQVESYLATLDPDSLSIADTAMTPRQYGHQRKLTMKDVQRVLDRAAGNADGTYRVLAGRALPGRTIGGFRYHGTRPDDPNDVIPHEHRRELRALKVFGAWTNLVDLKAGNTLDVVIEDNGHGVIRHYLQDVGSTFGTGAQGPRDWDEGYEYLYEGDALLKRLVSFGFYLRPWQTIAYADAPEIGRFEGDSFDPEQWRSRVPVAAVAHAREDDTFWAALRVAAFTDEMIRDVVRVAEFSEPLSTATLADVLIKRRDKIARTYLTKLTPLTTFALDDSGTLTFENAAVRAGVAAAPAGGYRGEWHVFDNVTGGVRSIGGSAGTGTRLPPPAGFTAQSADFVRIDVSIAHGPAALQAGAGETVPVKVFMRRAASGWQLVGIDRMPTAASPFQ